MSRVNAANERRYGTCRPESDKTDVASPDYMITCLILYLCL